MDCNSYSYTPHILDEEPAPKRAPVDAITVERHSHNGHTYFIIKDPAHISVWSTKAYTLESALKTAKDIFKNGI